MTPLTWTVFAIGAALFLAGAARAIYDAGYGDGWLDHSEGKISRRVPRAISRYKEKP